MAEQIKLFESPDGVAVQTPDQTTYVSVNLSKFAVGTVYWRVVSRRGDKTVSILFDLDVEMSRMLCKRIEAVAALAAAETEDESA